MACCVGPVASDFLPKCCWLNEATCRVKLPDLLHAVSHRRQQLLDELLGRQGPLFPPLFPLHRPGMQPAIVMGGLAGHSLSPPGAERPIRPQHSQLSLVHGPQSSKRPVGCPVAKSRNLPIQGGCRIFTDYESPGSRRYKRACAFGE